MGLFDGKKGLIFGVANKNSIAWAIAQALHEEGATLGFSYGHPILEKRVMPLAQQIGCSFVEVCDVQDDAALDRLFVKAEQTFGTLDFVVHSIAFADRNDLGGRFSETSRAGFALALDVSCYSLLAITQRARPLMPHGGSILTFSYYGAEKVIPNYNIMGVSKAALEASVRYLAWELGGERIRVNAISAGPIKTLAAAGITGFRRYRQFINTNAPLGGVNQSDVADSARFLLSDWSKQVTGEVLYVDGGYHVMGAIETAP